jgi:CheY-like chemotaxis protein
VCFIISSGSPRKAEGHAAEHARRSGRFDHPRGRICRGYERSSPSIGCATLEGTNFTIFLVDDDLAVLKALGRLLQSAGYATKAYSSAETFLSEDDGSLRGCVLLDLVMPVFNGLDIQEALARNGIKRPLIFLTGTATIADSVQAMRAGAVDFRQASRQGRTTERREVCGATGQGATQY